MRRLLMLLVVALTALSVGTSHAAKDSKASKVAKASHTALQGYCPVAYVAMGKAVKGDARISSTLNGHRYLFANADAKKMFDTDPGKYQIAYDGWCATAVSMGKKIKSVPGLFTVHAGRTYLFSNAEAKQSFDGMPEGVIMKADEQWAALTAK